MMVRAEALRNAAVLVTETGGTRISNGTQIEGADGQFSFRHSMETHRLVLSLEYAFLNAGRDRESMVNIGQHAYTRQCRIYIDTARVVSDIRLG
jgi:fido (protein-threonine AMPylation protein)